MAGEVFGSYRVVDEIGRGGMGAVYLAEHALLGRQAAIKVLLREMSHRQDLVARFFNEARAATAVKHPGIVEIYDFGYAADGSAYIVMEFLQGESLASRLQRRGPFAEARAAALCRQVAGGLGAAHAKGIVHRDLKPDNIFVVPDADVAEGERPKILDFGIAKLASEQSAGQSMTRTGMVMGTPAYMAPEQCKGAGQVDARSDLYALGCILFEMVCGRPPFVAEGAGEVMALHIFSQPPPPRMFAPVSAALEQIILRALAKDPEQRFRSAEDMAAALQAVQPSGAFPRTGATDSTRAMQPYGHGVPSVMPSAPRVRRHRGDLRRRPAVAELHGGDLQRRRVRGQHRDAEPDLLHRRHHVRSVDHDVRRHQVRQRPEQLVRGHGAVHQDRLRVQQPDLRAEREQHDQVVRRAQRHHVRDDHGHRLPVHPGPSGHLREGGHRELHADHVLVLGRHVRRFHEHRPPRHLHRGHRWRLVHDHVPERDPGVQLRRRCVQRVLRPVHDLTPRATLCPHDVTTDCGHLLCELIGRACSLATGRSRGCRPNLGSRTVAPDVVEEVRELLAVIDPDVRDERVHKAAVRLAEIMRREARDDRPLLAYARLEEPELAPALSRLCSRRR
jgi:predicted Ser/Thr protein kinase